MKIKFKIGEDHTDVENVGVCDLYAVENGDCRELATNEYDYLISGNAHELIGEDGKTGWYRSTANTAGAVRRWLAGEKIKLVEIN